MATESKSHFLWSVSLTCNIVICITIVSLYISHSDDKDGKQKSSFTSLKQDSLHTEKLTGENCIPTCASKECVMQAKSILSYMDSNADPCDNADSFMCGEFKKKFGPGDSGIIDDTAKEKLLIKLKDILDNIQAEPGSSSWKMKTVYDSCMDIGSSEVLGIVHFQKLLKNHLGITNWPYLNSDFEFADSSISKLLGHVLSLKDDFIALYISAPYEDGKNYTYSVWLDDSFFMNGTENQSEGEVHALEYFDLSQEDIEVILNDIKFVENSVKDLHSNLKHTMCEENCTYVYVNCSNLSDDEWISVCENVEIYHNEMKKITWNENKDAIVLKVQDEIFVKNFLPFVASLPHRSVANYFAFKLLLKYMEEINFYFRLTKMKFFDEEDIEVKVQPDLFKHCIKWITTNMKVSLQNEFFRHYLKNSVIDQVSSFHNDVKSYLNDLLQRQEWIPPEQKSRIVGEIGNLTLSLLMMKDIFENNKFMDAFEDHYKSIHPTRDSFFDNALLMYEKINRRFYDNLDYRTDSVLKFTEFDVDGYADIGNGMTILNYGMFFPPFYRPNIRRDVNRLSLGHTLGHEIGHHIVYYLLGGNEMYGKYIWRIDAPGLSSNVTDVLPEFMKVKQCIDDQFSEFKFDISKENLNGKRYTVENLPDYFAAVLVDKVLDEYDSTREMQFLLPGLAYSTKQLLYISVFQTFCQKHSLASEKIYLEDQRHAPSEYRIIGSLQNSRSYSEIFQCPDGSFMNPKKKCSLLSGI